MHPLAKKEIKNVIITLVRRVDILKEKSKRFQRNNDKSLMYENIDRTESLMKLVIYLNHMLLVMDDTIPVNPVTTPDCILPGCSPGDNEYAKDLKRYKKLTENNLAAIKEQTNALNEAINYNENMDSIYDEYDKIDAALKEDNRGRK